MLKDAAFQDFSHFLNGIIAYAKVTINGSTVKKEIHKREYMSDGSYAVYLNIAPQSGNATITSVQLFNTDQKLWAEKAVNIKTTSAQSGVLYRFVFKITEQEV